MFVGTVTVKLSKEEKWEGREIPVVELDFGKINGAMIDRIERETFGGGNVSAMNRPTSSEYCARLAAEISGVPFRFIEKLSFYDFEKVWQTVSSFLMHRDPQAFYKQFTEGDDDAGFTPPAEKPEEVKKPEVKPVTK